MRGLVAYLDEVDLGRGAANCLRGILCSFGEAGLDDEVVLGVLFPLAAFA